MKYKITNHQLRQEAMLLGGRIREQKFTKGYAIPRGGLSAAYLVQQYASFDLVSPGEADFYIDDIIDSGATEKKFNDKPFFALINKHTFLFENDLYSKTWLIFPWEETILRSADDVVFRMLQAIGEDAEREGLKETPARVIRAWETWFSGYNKQPEDVFKTFEDGGENYDQMVVVKDIPFYSHCEHHITPFFGTVTVAYIPDKKIVGLSKLSRLIDIFARRLQVQERLTTQIADTIVKHLEPLGVGVLVKARHLCMESRGIAKQGHHTVTSALHGALRNNPETRAEFMRLA